jgi:cytidyltransferase-like protein
VKIIGIIAEYNPFHNGHAYQIQKAKEQSGADCVIVAMSGNYVQRGMPAVTDKFTRAAMALSCGADLVFELPTLWSVSSAEYFAKAGTALLDALGCVDAISFGCETPDLSLFTTLADILAREPLAYSKALAGCLKQGYSFPAAREAALRSYAAQQNIRITEEDIAAILGSPNNILALEYIKALLNSQSSIRPLPILRSGSGYHDTELNGSFCSAAAIRKTLADPSASKQALRSCVPGTTADILFSPHTQPVTEQDFSEMLYYKLLAALPNGFLEYADSSLQLSNRIANALTEFTDYKSFCERLKTKEVTYTRISRLLLHILLDLKQSDVSVGVQNGYIPYLRLLGLRRASAELLSEIKKHTQLPLITKPSAYAPSKNSPAALFFGQDVFASNLYYGVLALKTGFRQKNEMQRELAVVP